MLTTFSSAELNPINIWKLSKFYLDTNFWTPFKILNIISLNNLFMGFYFENISDFIYVNELFFLYLLRFVKQRISQRDFCLFGHN